MLTYIVPTEFSFDRLVEVSKVDKRQKYFFRQREKPCQSHRSIKVHGARRDLRQLCLAEVITDKVRE